MENDYDGQRYVTWFLLQQGKIGAEISKQIQEVCGQGAAPTRTIYNWITLFKEGKTSKEDLAKSGRPSTSLTPEKIGIVREMIENDRRICISEIADRLGISYGSVFSIIHDQLNLSKLSCRWIPKLLTPENKQIRVSLSRALLDMANKEGDGFFDRIITGDEKWFLYSEAESKNESREWRTVGSPPPLKLRSSWSGRKQMAIVFWDSQGIILTKWLPQGQTVNAHFYCEVLKDLKEEIKLKRRGKLTRGVLLQHDNARPHTAHKTLLAIEQLGFELLPHPPYSPDLAPSDYWLFGEMAKHARGKSYSNIQHMSADLARWASEVETSWYSRGIKMLRERWERCIQMKGEYVEALDME